MSLLSKLFYLGSCRYQHIFEDCFPARLHTLPEFNNFLLHAMHLHEYIRSLSSPNLIFGDCHHASLIDEVSKYNTSLALKNKVGLIVEFCSLKYITIEGIPGSQCYFEMGRDIGSYDIGCVNFHVLNETDIAHQLGCLRKNVNQIFGASAPIFIMNHVDLLGDAGTRLKPRLDISTYLTGLLHQNSWPYKNIFYIDLWSELRDMGTQIEIFLGCKHEWNEFGYRVIEKLVRLKLASFENQYNRNCFF